MLRVSCILLFVNRKLLIARRPNKGANAGLWEFPGGKKHRFESDLECIVREIQEELCIAVAPVTQLESFNDGIIEITPFVCDEYQGVIENAEHQEVRFIHFEELNNFSWCSLDADIVTYIQTYPEVIAKRF